MGLCVDSPERRLDRLTIVVWVRYLERRGSFSQGSVWVEPTQTPCQLGVVNVPRYSHELRSCCTRGQISYGRSRCPSAPIQRGIFSTLRVFRTYAASVDVAFSRVIAVLYNRLEG